jgi:hypothetical protein
MRFTTNAVPPKELFQFGRDQVAHLEQSLAGSVHPRVKGV